MDDAVEIEMLSDELANQLEPHQHGQVVARRIGDLGWQFQAGRRGDLSAEDADRFDAWVRTAVAQLLETRNPEGNGWFPGASEPDIWVMTAAAPADPLPDPFTE